MQHKYSQHECLATHALPSRLHRAAQARDGEPQQDPVPPSKAGSPQPGGQQLHVGLPGGQPRELRGRGRQASISYSVGDPGWQRACQTSQLPFVSL